MPHCLSISQTGRTAIYSRSSTFGVIPIAFTCAFLLLEFACGFQVSFKSPIAKTLLPLRHSTVNHRHTFQRGHYKRVEKYRYTPKAMFTGIVEEIGRIQSIERDILISTWDGSEALGYRIYVSCKECLDGAYIGCSISVNGVCLTVVNLNETEFAADLAPETLRKTNLGSLKENSRVNLERSMLPGTRVSGHFVQGHVDNVGTILEMSKDGDSVWVKIKVPKEILHFIVEKGYIAVDGTSLTVCDVNSNESWFTLMLIPHTQEKVILTEKKNGDLVNIEVDMFGKYAFRFLEGIEGRLQTLERAMLSNREIGEK
ncbi:putative Riboflavin synthase [Cardiosporidium cionae]|uniref:Riboflavin synthase n=1 Tax=Cardiosporidium cionae TaxID=476202 RepID=A0ABQ7J5U0_9APIC|nr:putative Riboflavin synthase [Cardiosporidium cionae]|eukprot:KAF8819318.1 putative Riboflavin synthase [Cardiosporidium cionae]